MRIMLWHVHGAWTTSFVQGRHTYLIPATADRGPYGLGRASTYDWPAQAVEVTPRQLRHTDVDVLIVQRPQELSLAQRWLGREPGRHVPTVYVEHNTPRGNVPDNLHPVTGRDDLVLVHVTNFNELMWNSGSTPHRVIEHGVIDPGHRYSGELERLAVAVNEPLRRWRVTGTDLLPRFTEVAGVDVFGIDAGELTGVLPVATYDDPPQHRLHEELARRRAYLHPHRWTSLGLSLIEAMTMGIPVLVLAATEAVEAVPPDAGVLSTKVDVLVEAARWLMRDPDAARRMGERARQAALERYHLDRFLDDWDHLLKEVQSS